MIECEHDTSLIGTGHLFYHDQAGLAIPRTPAQAQASHDLLAKEVLGMADFELPYVNADEALTPKWQLVDVRKLRAREESNLELSGAVWIDPYDLSPQHPVFAEASRLLFFCVHGHEVSQYATAMGLLAGSDAAYVRGGFEALRAAGAPAQTLKGVA